VALVASLDQAVVAIPDSCPFVTCIAVVGPTDVVAIVGVDLA